MTKPRVRPLMRPLHEIGFSRETPNGMRLTEEGRNRLRRLWENKIRTKVGDLDRAGLERFPLSKRQFIVGRIKSERRGPVDAVRMLEKLLAYDRGVYAYQIAALRRRRQYVQGILRKQMKIAGGRELPILQSEVQKMSTLIEARQRTLAQRIDALKAVEGELRGEVDRLLRINKKETAEMEAEGILDDFMYRPLVASRLRAYRKSNQRFIRTRDERRDST